MTVRSEFDWGSISPSTAVVETVAKATGKAPEALEPLYGRFDPDGIDTLFGNRSPDRAQTGLSVSFRYAGHDVTVGETGVVTVRQTDG